MSGIVALMVGLFTFPFSLLADRFGRVRSLALLAILWSVATLACGLAKHFEHMFVARLFVGLGEAAYGSVGVAVIISVFPPHMRATITAAFMAGEMFGSVLGMSVGSVLAEQFGWRRSFVAMAAIAAIGMKTELKRLLEVGFKPIALMVGETLFLAALALLLLRSGL